jgi:aspartate racemase
MIGILGGMGTQAGLDFCNKLAMLNRGKIDQEYPLFILYNKSNIPGRPESIGLHAKKLSTIPKKPKNIIKYNKVLKSLLDGCRSLEKSGCKFIVIPCNTAHYWYEDLQNKINVPIINMPKEVFKYTKANCKKNSKIGLLATEGTLKTQIYNKLFKKDFTILQPS